MNVRFNGHFYLYLFFTIPVLFPGYRHHLSCRKDKRPEFEPFQLDNARNGVRQTLIEIGFKTGRNDDNESKGKYSRPLHSNLSEALMTHLMTFAQVAINKINNDREKVKILKHNRNHDYCSSLECRLSNAKIMFDCLFFMSFNLSPLCEVIWGDLKYRNGFTSQWSFIVVSYIFKTNNETI